MIRRGEVKVNGKVVTDLPVFINPRTDTVIAAGRRVELAGGGRGRGSAGPKRVYIAMNKPDRTLSTTKDASGFGDEEDAPRGARRTVLDLIGDKDLGRLYPVGRLGFHDTGLVLLTNDGELANRLTHARYGVPRTYVVIIRGDVPRDVLERMSRKLGASLGTKRDETAPPVQVLSADGRETELEVTLRESPKLRIDALIFEAGLKVKRLIRTAIGPISIRGIASGNWRFLQKHEVEGLFEVAGLSDDGRDSRRGMPGARPAGKAPSRSGPRRILPPRSADQSNGRRGGQGRDRRGAR